MDADAKAIMEGLGVLAQTLEAVRTQLVVLRRGNRRSCTA